MRWLKAFVAGAIAVVVFHQGMLALLHATGVTERAPFSMQPTAPLGVPQVLSLAFWGGVWGLVLLLVVRNLTRPAAYWTTAVVVGAVATTLVAGFVVAPLKGQPITGGGKASLFAIGLLVNGAWAFGTALLFRLLRALPTTSRPA
jgi:hypothetical protein